MAKYIFKLPDIGEGTAEAEIVAWHVKVGDRVAEDQPLVDMMTDKATVELTSPVNGAVLSIQGQVGDKTAVGTALVTLETEEGAAALEQVVPMPPTARPPALAAVRPPQSRPAVDIKSESHEPAPVSSAPRPLASPAVRRRAEERGIKLQFVRGTGPGGRITTDDLDAYASGEGASGRARPAGSGYAKRTGVEEVKVVGLRRKIAERMQLAKRHIPHFSYVEEVDVTELEDLRVHLNTTQSPDQPKLSLLPFIMRALVVALPDYPQINATYDDEAGIVHRHAAVHIGIAAQTTKGLMVPVVRHAEARDLWDSAKEIQRLAEAARTGKVSAEELSGSTITITSLGRLGGISTTPVINRPEVAIVGPNRIIERPVIRDGQVAVRKVMNISSSFDHRVVDGLDAAEFIQRVREMLEHPAMMFMR